jgi:hypothetical protein
MEATALTQEAAMSDPKSLALSVAEVIEESTNPRAELIALGMVASGIIGETPPEDRAELVETFCSILRKSVAGTMN